MEQEILVESYNAVSRRHGFLARDQNSAWLYLHEPSGDPNRSAPVEFTGFAFSQIPPIKKSEVHEFRPSPPPIVNSFASECAICENSDDYIWELAWSTDGQSIAVHRNGEPWCFITPNAPYGYSRAISIDGPWGKPWCSESFSQTDWVPRENAR